MVQGEVMDALTDEQIAALEAAEKQKAAPVGLTDEEIAAKEKEQSLFDMQQLIDDYIRPAGRFVDRYTGAPSRAFFSAAAEGREPLSAFVKQFGAEPEEAPTGKEQAEKMGLSTKPLSDRFPQFFSEEGSPNGGLMFPLKKGGILDTSPAGVTGLGLDIAEDWTNLIPISAATRGVVGAGKRVIPPAVETAAKVGGTVVKGTAAATDAATGTRVASNSVEGLATAVDKAKDATASAYRVFDQTFNPKISPTFSESLEVAKKNGINPEVLSPSIKYGKESSIARLQKIIGEGPTGEKFLESHKEGSRQIQKAIESKVSKVGGGVVLSEPDAGALIRDKFFERSKEFFDRMDITYKKVQKYAPGLYINKDALADFNSALNGVEKSAKGMMKRGITNTTRGQGAQLIRAVEALRSSKGNFKQFVEQLQEIGKIAYGKNANALSDVPADVEKFRDLYQRGKDALVHTIEKDVNQDFAAELLANNEAMSEYFSRKNVVSGAIGSKTLSDEGVFRNLVLSGDTQKIAALKGILGEDEIAQLKSSFLRSLIKKDANESFSFKTLFSAMRNKENQMTALFTPQEIKDIGDLVKLGVDHDIGIMSTSGTGASSAWRELPRAVTRSIFDENVLQWLKNRADRGLPDATKKVTPPPFTHGMSTPPPGGGLGEDGFMRLDLIPELLRKSKNARRPIDNRMKALQSISPSFYEKKKDKKSLRLRALGNN